MRLDGSCHCGAVRFSLETKTPYPYMRCYCSVCRKTAGGGGYAINLMGAADTLSVEGARNITVYHAVIDGERSPAERRFCKMCGSALWLWDPRWPDLVHPHASAIDTPLPVPPERAHIMLGSMPEWVEPDIREFDRRFDEYPTESIADWHSHRGLTADD
jgi:hypothetical protein